MPKVLVCIPTHNEAGSILELLWRIFDAYPIVDVLVIDDVSSGGTPDLVENRYMNQKGVFVLRRPTKDGLGNGYRVAFQWALSNNYEIVVQMDADLSHDPSDIPLLINSIVLGADLAIGWRYVPGGSVEDWPLRREWLSKFGNHYVGFMLNSKTKDSTSGFRSFSVNNIKKLNLIGTESNGYSFQIETLRRFCRANLLVVELPIKFTNRKFGESKINSRIILEAMIRVTVWCFRDIFGKAI